MKTNVFLGLGLACLLGIGGWTNPASAADTVAANIGVHPWYSPYWYGSVWLSNSNGTLYDPSLTMSIAQTVLSVPDAGGSVVLKTGNFNAVVHSNGMSFGNTPSAPAANNACPECILDVGGRLRIRQNPGSGANANSTAGIWLADNSGRDQMFVGMNQHSLTGTQTMGVYSRVGGWVFTVDGTGHMILSGTGGGGNVPHNCGIVQTTPGVATASCAAGQLAISGGGNCMNGAVKAAISSSSPSNSYGSTTNGMPVAWNISCASGSPTAHAICCDY